MHVSLFSRKRLHPEFYYPTGGTPRVAILHNCLRAGRNAQIIDPNDPDFLHALLTFQPHSIAAHYDVLVRLGAMLREQHKPANAVVVFTPAEAPVLSTQQRERLWCLFEVPVFEQVLSRAGELIAYECEAHTGLHLVVAGHIVPAPEATVGLCACGAEAVRIGIHPPQARSASAA